MRYHYYPDDGPESLSGRRIWILGKDVAILLCISLALTPAFRMRFWNLGGEGQILIGALATAACMIVLGKSLPNVVLIPVCILAALGAGAIWALIPAACKAKWNTNETLFTLMMNYVATQLVALLNILCVAVLTIVMYIYLNYSKQGYEISVVGESVATARYVGIKVGWTIMRTLILSGAICGLTGYLLVAGTEHTLTTSLAGGQGFTAVMVAWLAKFNPLGMVLSSLLLIFLALSGQRRGRDLYDLRPEPVLWRYPHRHYPVFHHRQRIFYQL